MEGRCLWINTDDVDGQLNEGHVVRATRTLRDWCLRSDAGSEPIAAGTLLKIVETRPWGAAMAQELPEVQPLDTSPEPITTAAMEPRAEGLWEFAS